MTFYKAHRNLLAQYIPSRHCLTVDASQGAEHSVGILSTGRRIASRESVGFIDDRRRNTVAMSRWQKKLIVLLHHDIGRHVGERGHPACAGQLWWSHFRYLAAEIGAVHDVGDLCNADFSIVAQEILYRIGHFSSSLGCKSVERAARSRAQFFSNYQANVVGRMDAPLPLEVSDDETELPSDTQKEFLENTDDRESDAANDLATLLPADTDDLPATWCPNFDMLWNTIRVEGPFSTQVFCFVVMGKLNHFWKARTYYMNSDDSEDLIYSPEPYEDPATVVRQEAMRSFATTMNWSLRQEYNIDWRTGDSEEAKEQGALLQQTIQYPKTRGYTLQELVASENACYQFLQDLYGTAGRSFFYSFGGKGRHPRNPVANLKNAQWELVLPYAIVYALVSRSASCEYRPTLRTRKAPQYALDAFVYDSWDHEWERLRHLENRPWKRQRMEDSRECIVTFTPYNCTEKARLAREESSGSQLSDYFLPLDELWNKAFEKEAWWYRAFYA